MSCNAGAGDKAKLARGHYSSRVLAPTGGGKTTICLGGNAKAAPKRQPRKGRGNPAFASQNAGFGQQNINQGMGNMSMGNQGRGMGNQGRGMGNQGRGMGNQGRGMGNQGRGMGNQGRGRGMGNQSQGIFGGQQPRAGGQKRTGTGGIRRNAGGQTGAAGGKAAIRDTGGYGTYDVTHASSRVLAQPGGGSSLSFGTSARAPQQRKPGNRRKNQPGGASTAFSNEPAKPKKYGNEAQRRAAKSLQSNIFGGPPATQPKRSNAKSRNAGGGAMSQDPHIKKRSTKNFKQPGGGQSQGSGQNKLSRKISQPTGGKSSNMFQPSTGGRPTPTTRVLASAGGGKSSAFSDSPVAQPRRGVGRVTKATGAGVAGGGRIKHTGGYGNYDINAPSSRVTHQPGGGSTVFGGGSTQSKPKTGVRRAQNRPGYGRAAGGSSAVKNSGGYGNLDIHSKASTRVHAPPGGKSNMPF